MGEKKQIHYYASTRVPGEQVEITILAQVKDYICIFVTGGIHIRPNPARFMSHFWKSNVFIILSHLTDNSWQLYIRFIG